MRTLVGNAGHLVDVILHRHGTTLEHLLIELLLLHVFQLSIQFRVVDHLSEMVRCDSIDDFLAEFVLFT
jgi:hypothetical protein